ncbi:MULTISPECIES: hypothetical protein [Arcobacter]|jgi:hypothetical protein|uniref:Membrane protein n=1 Tax=Arcobacter ellisii TaxID=913109 RepID=A0A347UC03_9BACT|nr:hypothetical protein [Arcobacter ellisii]AXX96381.1 putative membrane protein [Arcobacter ellisii]MBD3829582.1 hypothetical protein [Arcobacter sp.]RXI32836.1 hypothetical protein CP962_00075 [Arcobacter ellisii]
MFQLPLEILSNLASIILVIVLVISYLKQKKRIEVIKKLDSLKTENSLTPEDINYIDENINEFKEKSEKADNLVKILNPIFILAVGILFIYLPVSDAMIHLNVIIVAIIYVQLDKINKRNTLALLKELKK